MEKVKKTPRRLRQTHAKTEKGHVSWAKVGMVVKTPRTDHDDHGLNMFKYPSPNSRLGESCQDQMQTYMDQFKLPITSNHLSKIKKSNHSTSACNASKTKLLEWKGGKNLWALWPPSISWRLAQNRPQLSYPKKVGWLSVIGIETDLCGLALRMKLKKGDQQFWAPFLVVSCCIKMWKEIAIIFRITMAHVLGYISCILRHTHTSKCATSPGFFSSVTHTPKISLSNVFSATCSQFSTPNVWGISGLSCWQNWICCWTSWSLARSGKMHMLPCRHQPPSGNRSTSSNLQAARTTQSTIHPYITTWHNMATSIS